jgi:hypothetical protein
LYISVLGFSFEHNAKHLPNERAIPPYLPAFLILTKTTPLWYASPGTLLKGSVFAEQLIYMNYLFFPFHLID